MKIKPIGNKILVERDEIQDISAGGIVLATTQPDKPKSGTIIALGTQNANAKGEPIDFGVNVGDRIYIIEGAGMEIEHDGKTLLFIREEDIIAVA